MKKRMTLLLSILCLVLLVRIFKPLSFSKNPKMYTGTIASVQEGGVKDAVFTFENTETTYYINRGYELYAAKNVASLIGQEVVVYYSEGWTPLDPLNQRSKAIEKMVVGDVLFFGE